MYYRGANAAIIVYDITNENSFSDVENWLNGTLRSFEARWPTKLTREPLQSCDER